jgi:hypothetical protein
MKGKQNKKNLVYFVTVVHGPHSGLVNHPLTDARAVTRSPEKAKELLTELRKTFTDGECDMCGERFDMFTAIGEACDMGECPWDNERRICYSKIVRYNIGTDGVFAYLQRQIDKAFSQDEENSIWALLTPVKTVKNYAAPEYNKPVEWDTLYEEGIANV